MNNSGIEILLTSDCDYAELTVEIFYNGKFIALLNQDEGIENLKIEFPESGIDETKILRKLYLSILEKALNLAKNQIQS